MRSYGAFKVGNDKEVLKFISSANIACGYHAGDHNVMFETVRHALKCGVQIGAHPGLPDLAGFGRREMKLSPREVYNLVVYQIGALAAVCKVRVILGPHQNRFTEQSLKRFFTEEFLITPQSNRMGYQLTGPKMEHIKGPDIISDAIPLGGIQVPASGQPIILMADHQTTGGYTRIGTVISTDIPVLAQALPGTKVKFVEVTLQEGQTLYLKRRALVKHLTLTNK